jgi:hypothetical protein
METIRVFVRSDNTATLVCPACSKPKNMSVASFKDKCHFLKVRCPCEHVFRVHLDFRQHYRKTTNLTGNYVCLKPAGLGGGRITVNDISQGGVGITITDHHDLQIGALLDLTFHLDDRKRTLLKKKAIVRTIKGNFIGCQFTDRDLYEKEIGFYLKT